MARTYYAQILRQWDWPELVEDCKLGDAYIPNGEDTPMQSIYIGTVQRIMPSGKCYTPFACSNVTNREAEKDAAYMAALERVANKYGGWVESGEDDPCDLFFCMAAKEEEGGKNNA